MALLMVVVAMMTGCASNGNNTGTTTGSAAGNATTQQQTTAPAKREVLTARILRFAVNLDNVDGVNNDRIKKFLEDKFSIKIEYVSALADAFKNKITTSMATGEVYDIINDFYFGAWSGVDIDKDTWKKWIDQGMLTDISEIVNKDPSKYSALKKQLDDPVFKMYSDICNFGTGKDYCLFTLGYGANKGFYDGYQWNKKYLDAVGAQLPTTWDEFANVLRAIKAGDPDGNGKKGDTIPFSFRTYKGTNNTADFQTLFSAYGLPTAAVKTGKRTAIVDGKAVDLATSDITKQCWTMLNQWALEGLLDKEAVTQDPDYAFMDKFAAGKIAGVGYAIPNNSNSQYLNYWNNTIKKANPSVKPADYPISQPLKGPAGLPTYSWVTQSPAYITFIPKESKCADRMVELLDYLSTTEGQNLLWYGVEGVSYTKNADGTIFFNEDEYRKDATNVYFKNAPNRFEYPMLDTQTTQQEYIDYDKYNSWYEAYNNSYTIMDERGVAKDDAYNAITSYMTEWIPQIFKERPAFEAAMNYSDADSAIDKKLTDITNKYTSKWLTGSAKVADTWDAYVAELKAAGLDTLTQRTLEVYNTAKATYDKYVK
jgi:ABC-type sugar transport system, periplasmic component